jgi:non-ribosomal peptide synthetase-like protein
MARFCAKIRQHPGLSDVSMRDIYLNPTIAKLAAHLGAAEVDEAPAPTKELPFRIPSNLEYYGCGALQLLFYAATGALGLWLLATGFEWTYAAVDRPAELYLRLVSYGFGTFVLLNAIPIAAKWLLIGKWKEEVIPIWSLRYFRFWLVKTLVRSAPMAAFGSPIRNLYLRLLGAKIGRNTVINSRLIPVCTDLFSVGSDTILQKDSILLGYKAQSNYIYTGSIAIGDNAYVGQASVLAIDTAMGNDTQLGHASSLQSGQRVPDGKRYHGSPAQETTADYCPVERRECSALRRWLYAGIPLATGFAIFAPISVMILYRLFPAFVELTSAARLDHVAPTLALASLTLEMLLVSFAAFFGSLLTGLVAVAAIPRLLRPLLQEDRTYVLYGFRYWVHGIVSGVSNSTLYNDLLGDSSFIVHYLKLVGWNLNKVTQSGSNFGTEQKHDNPFLCDIGSGTMVSDGLSMMNAQMSSSSFKLSKVKIGDRNYLGNNIHYPAEGKTGANCLLGTKVMIPIDGAVREDVGLLGSPCFEIPRAVDRDKNFVAAMSEETRQQRLRMKNRHNIATMAAWLMFYWMVSFITLTLGLVAILYYPVYGVLSLLAFGTALPLIVIPLFALMDRASIGFKRLQPKAVSIYDEYFWTHERHWKLSASPIYGLFKGTPFKNLVSRMLGVTLGRKVFDDGCTMPEKTLTQVGDYANLNENTLLQGHSLEEGVFKSDYIKIGSGCSIGSNAFVHYGVTMGDRAVLDPDSFLMKGETVEAHAHWRGNPAKAVRNSAPAAAVKEVAQPVASEPFVLAKAA